MTATNFNARTPAVRSPAMLALAGVALGSAALLAGAWWFELVLGLLPCKLCLQQRWPHYAALALGAVALAGSAAGWRPGRGAQTSILAALGLIMLISAGMGAYHSGVEWGVFAGPNDCAGSAPAAAASTADFMRQLQTTRVVSCTEAAWRFMGLSLAGWNVVASLGLASLAFIGLRRA
jgi:disulfide bond formation protein DsbB